MVSDKNVSFFFIRWPKIKSNDILLNIFVYMTFLLHRQVICLVFQYHQKKNINGAKIPTLVMSSEVYEYANHFPADVVACICILKPYRRHILWHNNMSHVACLTLTGIYNKICTPIGEIKKGWLLKLAVDVVVLDQSTGTFGIDAVCCGCVQETDSSPRLRSFTMQINFTAVCVELIYILTKFRAVFQTASCALSNMPK